MTSMPEYWLAILFIYYLGVRWQLLPFVGSDSATFRATHLHHCCYRRMSYLIDDIAPYCANIR